MMITQRTWFSLPQSVLLNHLEYKPIWLRAYTSRKSEPGGSGQPIKPGGGYVSMRHFLLIIVVIFA